MFSPDRFDEGQGTAPVEQPKEAPPIQEQANFKGNYTELLFSRMNNPVIRNQLLDLKEQNEKWIAEHPPNDIAFKKDPITGEDMYDDGIPVFERVPGTYIPKTREQLNQEIEEGLVRETSFTSVDFDKPLDDSVNSTLVDHSQNIDSPANRTATIGVQREGNSPLTEEEIRTYSLVEAHEKGHVFRKLTPSQYLKDRFSQAFDISKINLDTYFPGGRPEGATDEQLKEAVEGYFNLSDPHEFIERMGQLKGYFGMKGDEKFTPQQLEHARKHYLTDGMMDNNMKSFFEAITPETEFAFLKLINSIGV